MIVAVDVLRDALKFAGSAITGRAPLPVLECVLLTVKGDVLRVQGSNLDVFAEATLEGREGDLAGWRCCVSHSRLSGWLAGVKGEVVLSLDEGEVKLTARAGQAKAVFAGLPGAEFPEWPEGGEEKEVVWPEGKGVLDGLRRVSPAASAEKTRYVLMGVLWCAGEEEEGGMWMVATDGKRMHRALVKGVPWGDGVIVPSAALDGVCAVLGEEGEVRVRTGRWMDVQAGRRRVVTKLIEGNFPNFRAVLPAVRTRIGRVRDVNGKGMVEAIGRVGVMMQKGKNLTPSVKVRVEVDGRVCVSGESADVGRAEEVVEGGKAVWQGKGQEEVVMAFNPEFFSQALAAAGEGAEVWLFGEAAPAMVVNEGTGFEGVIMPMRVGG